MLEVKRPMRILGLGLSTLRLVLQTVCSLALGTQGTHLSHISGFSFLQKEPKPWQVHDGKQRKAQHSMWDAQHSLQKCIRIQTKIFTVGTHSEASTTSSDPQLRGYFKTKSHQSSSKSHSFQKLTPVSCIGMLQTKLLNFKAKASNFRGSSFHVYANVPRNT